eukprot:4546-Heterococcus_DN1.PRE.1
MKHKAWIKEEQARGNTEMGTGAELDKAMEEVQRDYAAEISEEYNIPIDFRYRDIPLPAPTKKGKTYRYK